MSDQFSLCSAPVMPGIDAEPLWKQVADEQIARKKNIKACNISIAVNMWPCKNTCKQLNEGKSKLRTMFRSLGELLKIERARLIIVDPKLSRSCDAEWPQARITPR